MTLSPADEHTIRQALGKVRLAAELAQQAHDLDEALKALLEVRNAAVRAAAAIRLAEINTRAAA